MHDSVMLVSGGKYFFLFFILALFLSTAEVQAADPNKGRELYMQHCNSCHEPGREMAGAPDFNYGSTMMQSDPVLIEKIRSGKNAMPGYAGILQDYMIMDIIAYMRTF